MVLWVIKVGYLDFQKRWRNHAKQNCSWPACCDIAYACLAMAGSADVEAAGGSYLMARFWDNKNFSSLLWEHYYEYICPQQPGHIGNVNLAMAGVDNRFESANAYGYSGYCETTIMYKYANLSGTSYQCGGGGCSDLGLLNNDVTSYKLFR